MKYYRITEKGGGKQPLVLNRKTYGWHVGDVMVKDELLTPKEFSDKYSTALIPDDWYESVEISRKQTVRIFGARFAL